MNPGIWIGITFLFLCLILSCILTTICRLKYTNNINKLLYMDSSIFNRSHMTVEEYFGKEPILGEIYNEENHMYYKNDKLNTSRPLKDDPTVDLGDYGRKSHDNSQYFGDALNPVKPPHNSFVTSRNAFTSKFNSKLEKVTTTKTLPQPEIPEDRNNSFDNNDDRRSSITNMINNLLEEKEIERSKKSKNSYKIEKKLSFENSSKKLRFNKSDIIEHEDKLSEETIVKIPSFNTSKIDSHEFLKLKENDQSDINKHSNDGLNDGNNDNASVIAVKKHSENNFSEINFSKKIEENVESQNTEEDKINKADSSEKLKNDETPDREKDQMVNPNNDNYELNDNEIVNSERDIKDHERHNDDITFKQRDDLLLQTDTQNTNDNADVCEKNNSILKKHNNIVINNNFVNLNTTGGGNNNTHHLEKEKSIEYTVKKFLITMKDYDKLRPEELIKYDRRSLCKYIYDELRRYHIIASIFLKYSIIDPIYIRLFKFFIICHMLYGFNAIMYTDDYIDSLARNNTVNFFNS
jgi:hypothetical protein